MDRFALPYGAAGGRRIASRRHWLALANVPEHVDRSRDDAAHHALADHRIEIEVAQRRQDPALVSFQLDRRGDLLALRRIAGDKVIILELLNLVVSRPAEPAFLAIARQRSEEQWIHRVAGRPSRNEQVPATLVGRRLAGSAR